MNREAGLVEKDYSQQPRTQTAYFGETAAVSEFDAEDLRDMDNMAMIFSGQETQKYFSDAANSTLAQNIEFAQNTNEDLHVYAVRGSSDGPVASSEVGEVQGYVSIFTEEVDPVLNTLVDQGIFPEGFQNKKVFGLDYAVRPETPRHQMASGVRTVCQLTRINELKNNAADPSDLSAHPNDIQIIAFVELGNEKSEKLLSSCGFEKMPGEITHEVVTDGRSSSVWLLNYEKLDQIMQQKASHKLLKPTQS